MPLLVRKIERAKWDQNEPTEAKQVSADAITSCRTAQNALSLWEVAGDGDIGDAVLAIATTFDKPVGVHVVLFPPDSLAAAGLQVERTDGITPVYDLVPTHRVLADLTYESLGTLADLILACLREERVKQYTKRDVRNIITGAIEAGRLQLEELKESMKAEL